MKSLSVAVQMTATEQYFPVVLFIILLQIIPTFHGVDETLITYAVEVSLFLTVILPWRGFFYLSCPSCP